MGTLEDLYMDSYAFIDHDIAVDFKALGNKTKLVCAL